VRFGDGWTQIHESGAALVSVHSTALAPCGVVVGVIVPGMEPTPFCTGPSQSSWPVGVLPSRFGPVGTRTSGWRPGGNCSGPTW
jgi:hypothetical protein